MFTPAPVLAPPRDASELLRRLLALIDSLHQPQDLELERLRPLIGSPMTRVPDASPQSRRHEVFQPLTKEWLYRLVWDLDGVTRLPDLGLLFYETQGGATNPTMTDICHIDASQFHDALLTMGYRHVGSTRRASPARQYQRGSVEVEIGIVGESGENLEKISHDCIKRVSVGFLERYIDLGAAP